MEGVSEQETGVGNKKKKRKHLTKPSVHYFYPFHFVVLDEAHISKTRAVKL